MLIGVIYKDIFSEKTNIKHEEGRAVRAEYLYSIETKLVLFNLTYYTFKIIRIPKVTTKKTTKSICRNEIKRERKWYTTKMTKYKNSVIKN